MTLAINIVSEQKSCVLSLKKILSTTTCPKWAIPEFSCRIQINVGGRTIDILTWYLFSIQLIVSINRKAARP